MKKIITAFSVLSLVAACVNTKESTMEDFWRDAIGEEQTLSNYKTVTNTPKNENFVSQKDREQIIIIDENDTYQLPSRDEVIYEFAPLPEVFAIPATRATNKMLDETRNLHEGNDDVFLFIAALRKNDGKMPDGIYKAEQVTRKIIDGSKAFKIVNNKAEADYILSPVIDNIGSTENPIVEYRIILTDSENNKINEWVEVVRRLNNNDRSWW